MTSFPAKLDEYTQGDKPKSLGVVTCAVNANGETFATHAVGRTNLDQAAAQPIDVDSILTLASATKLVTTIAALQLVEQGKINLDDSALVETHLPELCRQEIMTTSQPDQPLAFEPRKKPITVRHLITHTSGSGFDLMNPLVMAWRKSRGQGPMCLTAGMPEAYEIPGLFQPGEGWEYGGGLDWTGLLIERITEMSLGAFMRKEIFDVVGCDERIGFDRDDVAKHGTVVQTVMVTEEGELAPHHIHPAVKCDRGGGGLFSSARNYVKILVDLIAPESKLLKPSSIDLLFSRQLEDNPKALAALRANTPVFTSMCGPLTASTAAEALDHSLGGLLILDDNEVLGKTKGTLSWGGAFSCLWFLNREHGIAAFYGSSVVPPGAGVAKDLMGEFVKEVWSKIQ